MNSFICDMTHTNMSARRAATTIAGDYVTRLIRMRHDSFICDMTHTKMSARRATTTYIYMKYAICTTQYVYGVAMINSLLIITGLFCKRAL